MHAGLNTGFPSGDVRRALIVVPPRNAGGPAPVWVPLTGSVESTADNLYVERSSANAKLAAGACNGPGHGGWTSR